MSTPRPAATLLALMIATLPRPALWNPSPDTLHDHAARTRGAIATPDHPAHSVLAFPLLHTAASLIPQPLHTSQTPRTRSGASRAAEQPRLRGALPAGEPTFMMWISLPKTNLPAISDGSTHTQYSDEMRREARPGQTRHTDEHLQTCTRARAGARAQLQPSQYDTSHICSHPSGLNTRYCMNYSGGHGQRRGRAAAPQGEAAQEATRKRPAGRATEGGHSQPQATLVKLHRIITGHTRSHCGARGYPMHHGGRAAAPLGKAAHDPTRKRPAARTTEGGHSQLQAVHCKWHRNNNRHIMSQCGARAFSTRHLRNYGGRAAVPQGMAAQDATRKRPEARTRGGGHNLSLIHI